MSAQHLDHRSGRFALHRIAACACLCLAAASAWAQSAVEPSALAECARITEDVARLACYDTLADAMASSPEGAAARAAQSREPTAPGPSPAPGIDAFGVEQVPDSGFEAPDRIRSRLVGDFTGWRGNTVFRLENGQVWRQSEQDRVVFEAEAPMVTIERGSFGTYRLSVEGINSSVRVRRVE